MEGVFRRWVQENVYGFIVSPEIQNDIFFHISDAVGVPIPEPGNTVEFTVEYSDRGQAAKNVKVIESASNQNIPLSSNPNGDFLYEEIEELDTSTVDMDLLKEIASWKREAKAENSYRYFWHVREVDQISNGEKHFVIGRKGAGKTAICEHFDKISEFNVFSEKLSFKQFPFNDLYNKTNSSYTAPNQYITIWKCLIYSTICRLMLKNNAIENTVREGLSSIFDDNSSLSRRVKKWTGDEFGFSLFGVTVKLKNESKDLKDIDWIERVDYLEDLLIEYAGDASYYVLFDELDEDYRDVINADQHNQYTALITSLFKAVQDIRTTFDYHKAPKILPENGDTHHLKEHQGNVGTGQINHENNSVDRFLMPVSGVFKSFRLLEN